MEKDSLIIISIMLVSFLVLAFSVGRITGLVTSDFKINTQEKNIIYTQDYPQEEPPKQEKDYPQEDINNSKDNKE